MAEFVPTQRGEYLLKLKDIYIELIENVKPYTIQNLQHETERIVTLLRAGHQTVRQKMKNRKVTERLQTLRARLEKSGHLPV